MPKNRLLLISLAALIVALGTIVFAPFVVSNGVRLWLRWQAHRQQLKIELGKIAAPFLRPVSIERIRVTSEPGAATQIELNAELAILHLSLAKILAGRGDGVRTLSIQRARAAIRRDYSEKVRAMLFNWTALQSLLPANFDIAHLDFRVENGPTVILLRNAAISGSQIEAGRFSAGELTITSPLFRQTFSQLRGAIKWQEDRLTIGGLNLARGVHLESPTLEFSRPDKQRDALPFALDVFGGKSLARLSNPTAARHYLWIL